MNTEDIRLSAKDRLLSIVDENSFHETDKFFESIDPLGFHGYKDKIETAQKSTELNEAIITGFGKIGSIPCIVLVMDSHFMMGSMGMIVGEKVCRSFEYAIKRRLPVIAFTASGGARMQEGALSLFQMVKTSGVVNRHSSKGQLFISVITDPTMGGVSASFASQADIIIAEPGVTFGFTGKRIIQETFNKKLPEGFQTAEYALKNGMIDMIIDRADLKGVLVSLLQLHRKNSKLKN